MRLLVFGDYHYVSSKNYDPEKEYYEYSQEFIDLKNEFHQYSIDQLFKPQADYYISLGDLTNVGAEDEIEDIYKLIENTGKMDKFIHVFGNHDLYLHSAEEVSEMTGQDYNYSIDLDHAKLIFYISAADKDPENWGGHLTEEDAHWLSQEILEADGKAILIFAHHPIYDTTRRTCMEKLYIAPADRMRQALDQHKGQGIFIAGHNHAESIAIDDNWTYVNIDAFLDHPKYSVIDIEKDKIDISSVDIEINDRLEESRKIIGSHMPYFQLLPQGRGTSLDREITITL